MSDISRADIGPIILNTVVDADTPEGRNEQRRQAVIEFLADKPNGQGIQGTVHDMILSDLHSYPGWENVQ